VSCYFLLLLNLIVIVTNALQEIKNYNKSKDFTRESSRRGEDGIEY
jgi:hypothetical protein